MDRLDKTKAVAKQRLGKPKVPAPPGELIALGSKPKAEAEPGTSSKAPTARRDAQPPVGLLLPLSKKTVLPYAPSTSAKAAAVDHERSSTSQAQYDEAAIECAPAEFYDAFMAAYDAHDGERVERLLCGAVRYLKNSRAKPDSQIVLALLYFSKVYPDVFMADNVTSAFSSLLKRDPSISFKSKGNPLVTVLACNVLYAAFASEEQWPDIFIKVFLEDSMGERIWVDRADCRCFTENIITAYGTKFPPRSMMTQDAVVPLTPGVSAASSAVPATTSPSSTPRAPSGYPDEEPMELGSVPMTGGAGSSAALAALSERLDNVEESEPIVLPRYIYQQEALERQATEFMNEQFGKRQPVDVSSRQLLKTIATMCGIVDVRLAAVQRLEMWLQNPKLSRSAQDLLLFICYNCGQRGIGMGDPKELEVATQLLKLRLKTKQLLSHYLMCIKELMSQNDYNLHTIIALTVYNELSNARNSNNMAVLGTAVQVSSDKASAIIAEVFLDLLMNKEDYLRALRTLLREIVRSVRNDLDFPAFCLALMTERKAEKFNELDPSTKERLFLAIADLVALSQLLCITPSVREAVASASKGDRRDIQSMRLFWKQVSTIQRDSVWWMQDVVPNSFDLNSQDYISGLYKILMMQPAEHYYKVDGWPPESERQSVLRIATETPVREDTLIRIIIIGLTANLPLNATDALDVADLMVRRAAAAATTIAGHVGIHGASLLDVSNLDLIQLLFSAAAYHHPESIKLPKGYEPPCLAIATSYWKVWQMVLIISAFNPTTFGRFAWDSYETLRIMMEMVMTNNYRYPPPTTSPDDSVTQMYLQKERQAVEQEKQAILEFEVHLAAASSKSTITEQNSHLLSRLMAMDPTGICRKPPDEVLENLKTTNKAMNLGSLLCRSRNPDFLLSIIGRQGTAGSMPWLADLVEASEGSLDVLPVQCLCEFLLHESPAQLPLSSATNAAAAAVMTAEEAASAAALSARRKSSSSSIMSAASAARDGDTSDYAERFGRSVSVQQSSKHDKLLARLRSTLFTPEALTPVAAASSSEILAYFLQRLQLPSSASRAAALKGLASVLAGGQRQKSDNAMDTDDECRNAATSAVDNSSHKFGWLLDGLPTIPAYPHVKALVLTRLCEALHVESSVDALEAYLTYVSRECLDSDDQLLTSTVEAVSRTLIGRSVVLCNLLARSSRDSSGRRSDLQSSLLMAYKEFTQRARSSRWPAGSRAISETAGTGVTVVVQWNSGVSAAMSDVVIQATVMLLAVCQTDAVDRSLSELCEVWFPSADVQPFIQLLDSGNAGHRRRISLTDDSVCPDFLRMLMLQSGRQQLIDAALDGVSTTKLLVFVQSFGVPATGASRLLRALDERSRSQPEEVLVASEERRDYLVELVDIQHLRGIAEGVHFRSLLHEGGKQTSSDAAAGGASGSVSQHTPGTSSASPAVLDARPWEPSTRGDRGGGSSTVTVPDTLLDMLEFIRTGILTSRTPAPTVRRSCRALQIKMAAHEPIRHVFVLACSEMLKTTNGLEPAKAFWGISTDIAPVLRLVIGLLRPTSRIRTHKESEASAAAAALFDALRQCDPCRGSGSSGPLHTIVAKAAAWLHPDMEASSPGDVDLVGLRDSKAELALSTAMTELVIAGQPDEAAKLCIRKIDELEQREMPRPATSVGLLVDWLQAVNLEIVSSSVACDQQRVDLEVLRLLFGCRCGRDGVTTGTACATYLRAVLLHQASWNTIRSVIGCLLGGDQAIGEDWVLDPTAVLDFLTGCLHQPKLYQGRVRKKPRKSRPDDVLGLAADAVCRVAELVVRESAGKSKEAVVKGLDRRVELLCACCHEDTDKLRVLARHVEARALAPRRGATGGLSSAATSAAVMQPAKSSDSGHAGSRALAGERQAYEYLLVRLYAWVPRTIKWLRDDGDALDDDPVVLLHGPCALDMQTHKVLTALGAAVGPKKKHETALNEANLLCRKLATDHPLLFLRQLPMMLALLSGRCAFTFNEFKHRNHLLLFTHVFGLAELLQPHLFGHPSFGEFVSLYLDFFKVYSQKALATFFGKFVQLLHNFVHCMPSKMAQVLGGHAAVLGYLCNLYPAMSQAKSLLSAVSMPQKEASGVPSDEEKRTAMPVLNPPLTAEQLAPFRARLNKEASIDDVLAVLKDIDSTSMIKVDILSNFIDDLKRLLCVNNNECRNTAHVLMMRCLRHSPRYARDFVDSYAACLEHENGDVKKSALLNLAEFTVLCDEDDAAALLQRAFVAALKLDGGESMTHVKEALQLLHLENVQIT